MSAKVPKFELEKNPDYRVIYVNGVFGSVNPLEGRIIFYMDNIIPKFKEKRQLPDEMELDKVVRELMVEVRMSPAQFKSIAEWMTNHIKRLEKEGVKFPKGEPSKSYVA